MSEKINTIPRCSCGQMLLADEVHSGKCYYCHNNLVSKDKKPRPIIDERAARMK